MWNCIGSSMIIEPREFDDEGTGMPFAMVIAGTVLLISKRDFEDNNDS